VASALLLPGGDSAPAAPAPAKCSARIITTDKDARLWALDAKTGEVCDGFGDTGKGYTDLSVGMGQHQDFYYMPTSQPLVAVTAWSSAAGSGTARRPSNLPAWCVPTA
jgi:glucose dehydrogenase